MILGNPAPEECKYISLRNPKLQITNNKQILNPKFEILNVEFAGFRILVIRIYDLFVI